MLCGTYDIFLVLSLFYFLQVPPRAVAPGHEFAAPPPVTPLDLTGQAPLRHPPRAVPTSVPSMGLECGPLHAGLRSMSHSILWT